MQSQPRTSFLQDFSSFHLFRRELRDYACVHESIERLDVIRIPFRVHTWSGPCFKVENRGFDIRFFTLANFAFAVKVPYWLCQCFSYVWTFFLENVPDVVRGDDVGFAAFESSGNTEETNDITVVCMEELPGFLACVGPERNGIHTVHWFCIFALCRFVLHHHLHP